MSRFVMALTVVLALAACAPSSGVRVTTDPVRGSTTTELASNRLAGGCFGCPAVDLNIRKFVSGGGRVTYYLVAQYQGHEWLFVQRGQSLSVRADGLLIAFESAEGSAPYRRVLYGGQVSETAFYEVTAQELRFIADAREVFVRIDGSARYVTREFSRGNFERFQSFVLEHVN